MNAIATMLQETEELPSDQAMKELIELVTLAQDKPIISMGYQEFLKMGLPVLKCSVNEEATKRTGMFVHF